MKISGVPIAKRILRNLKNEIKKNHLHPHLAIILAGDNPNSKTYVAHKQKRAESIGIKTTLYTFLPSQQKMYFETIKSLNHDSTVNGIITQLPLYTQWDSERCINAIASQKDVDGFKNDSPFAGATALGVWEMLGAFGKKEKYQTTEEFLKGKKIIVLGKGQTAGKPTLKLLASKGFTPQLIDSKTVNSNEIVKNADVIISATGKKHIITADKIKRGSYVIGIGVGKEEIGNKVQTYGDIDPNVKYKARLYCPTIGGIGPLTIACLLQNVVRASFT